MKSSAEAELTIGELAGHFGLATHVLRHWETMGLLAPSRRVNGQRRYGQDQRIRVAIILLGKHTGLSLGELRTMLSAANGQDRRAVFLRQRDDLNRRIARAQASRTLIDHALACPVEDFLRCPNFQRLVQEVDLAAFEHHIDE